MAGDRPSRCMAADIVGRSFSQGRRMNQVAVPRETKIEKPASNLIASSPKAL